VGLVSRRHRASKAIEAAVDLGDRLVHSVAHDLKADPTTSSLVSMRSSREIGFKGR
jgi:hypothetical protein